MLSDESQQPSSPKTLGQILEAFPLQASSGSTPLVNAENLSTTGKAVAKPGQIGKPLSETVLGSLRNIARSVQSGILLDDKMLETLLVQSLGSLRFASKPKLQHKYDQDGGYDCEIVAYDIALDRLDDAEMKLYDAVEFLNKPAPEEFVAKQIGRLQAVMARRSESNADLAVVLDTYVGALRSYPPDAVKKVCDDAIASQKWFPLAKDLITELERIMRFRRAVLRCFEECRNPLLAAKRQQQRLAADPRRGMHYKELRKEQWLKCHYEWWIGDAEKMVALSKESGRTIEADEWQVVLEKRQAEMKAAGF